MDNLQPGNIPDVWQVETDPVPVQFQFVGSDVDVFLDAPFKPRRFPIQYSYVL